MHNATAGEAVVNASVMSFHGSAFRYEPIYPGRLPNRQPRDGHQTRDSRARLPFAEDKIGICRVGRKPAVTRWFHGMTLRKFQYSINRAKKYDCSSLNLLSSLPPIEEIAGERNRAVRSQLCAISAHQFLPFPINEYRQIKLTASGYKPRPDFGIREVSFSGRHSQWSTDVRPPEPGGGAGRGCD